MHPDATRHILLSLLEGENVLPPEDADMRVLVTESLHRPSLPGDLARLLVETLDAATRDAAACRDGGGTGGNPSEATMRDVEIAKYFIKATTSILSTMAGITATPGTPYVKKDQSASGDISAIIGLTGPKNGSVSVSFSFKSAESLVRGMLGDDIGDLEQDMQDAVGELTNMISGQARAGIAEAGLVLHGATPSVVVGKGHKIHHMTKSIVMAIPFTTQDGDFTVEFCLA